MAPQDGGPEPEARRRVLEAVLDFPALRHVDIARITGLSQSHVDYHVEALLDAELVVDATVEGHRRFYPIPGPHAPDVRDAERLAVLREPVPLHIALLVLQENGSMTHAALHGHLGIAKSTLSFHLNKLVETRVLDKAGRSGYAPVDREALERLLVRFRPFPGLLDLHLALWLPLYRRAVSTP